MQPESFLSDRVALHAGDCLTHLPQLAESSLDACVVDPPYGIGFMGKAWDHGVPGVPYWKAVYRVLKPGAYLLAFSSCRTFGRMQVAIEDAGFITHPFIAWIFGQGFPKATRIKADGYDGWRYGAQALKPAIEPIYMGQKPFSEKTGTANVLKWGTGALNIGACRVSAGGHARDADRASADRRYPDGGSTNFAATPGPRGGSPTGRWPANVIHDGSDEVVGAFPESGPGPGNIHNAKENGGGVFGGGRMGIENIFKDSGSAARFFYTSKADSLDRAGSRHPTVKPVDLIQYLVRLVTPPGGTCLDCFAGTGTTGEAAFREGMRAVLIEREAEYCDDIRRRMALVLAGPGERRRAIQKARHDAPAAGPLFTL